MRKKQRHIPLVIAFIFAGLSASCNTGQNRYSASLMLHQEEQSVFIESIIRYAGHLPPRADHESKFLAIYDEYYNTIAARHSLEYLYIDTEGLHHFLLVRPAPSLYEKEVAIAGSVKFTEFGAIEYYKEIFRTWKMERQELLEKSEILFDLMVKGEELTTFYPENSGDEEFIEFPNKYTRFDSETRTWVSDLFIPSFDIH